MVTKPNIGQENWGPDMLAALDELETDRIDGDDALSQRIDVVIPSTDWVDASSAIQSDWVGEAWLRRIGARVTLRLGLLPSPTLDGNPRVSSGSFVLFGAVAVGFGPAIFGSGTYPGAWMGVVSDSINQLYGIDVNNAGVDGISVFLTAPPDVTGNWDETLDYIMGEFTWISDDEFPL